jgi:hypothetical protein
MIRMTLAAALLAVPGIAVAQTQGQSMPGQSMPGQSMPGQSGTQPSPTRPMNPATDPTAPAVIAPTMPGAGSMSGASLNPPAAAATPGSVMASRPRMSQIIGTRIYNDRDQNVGEVDDVLLTPNGPMAIVQVGGFLGIGGRLVQMPLNDVRWNAERERLVLPGASKEALETRPAFEYDPAHRRR